MGQFHEGGLRRCVEGDGGAGRGGGGGVKTSVQDAGLGCN